MADGINPYDVNALERAVNDSATRVSGIWLSFVAFSAYLAAAASMITHRQIFLEEPIKLPTVNIDLPLVASAILLPLLFVIYHVFVLLQVVLLARTAAAYNEAVEHSVADAENQTRVRQRLANTLFAQLFAGSPRERTGVLGWLLRGMAWITLAIAPIFVLLVFEIKFLPYHSALVTWTHRGLIAVDLLTVLTLWAGAIRPRTDIDWRTLRNSWKTSIGGVIVILGCCFWLAFPGESQSGWMRNWGAASNDAAVSAPECRLPWLLAELLPARFDRLSLYNFNLTDSEKLTKIESAATARRLAPDKADRTRSLVSRDFRCADFAAADLRYIDLSGSNLTGARLDGAQLTGARMQGVVLFSASLAGTELEGADLSGAKLQGAYLESAHLQNILLPNAQLQGANLKEANLNGAHLKDARLDGAFLARAQLRAADLTNASLSLVELNKAQLQGATVSNTQFDDADLSEAKLTGANIQASSFARTNLYRAELQGATIGGVSKFPGALLVETQLQGVDLETADLGGAVIAKARVWRAANFDCDKARVVAPVLDQLIFKAPPTRLILAVSEVGPADLGKFVTDVTQGMPDDVKKTVTDRMQSHLGGIADAEEEDRAKRYWALCADETATRKETNYSVDADQSQKQFGELSIDLACAPDPAQPHIAAGILRRMIVQRDDARRLLGQGGKPCPGAQGLSVDIKARLRGVANK